MPSTKNPIRAAILAILTVLAVSASGLGSAAAATLVSDGPTTNPVRTHHETRHHQAKKTKQAIAKAASAASRKNKATTVVADAKLSNGTPQPAGVSGKWNLVMDSEFTGSSLNSSVWRTGWFGSGVTNPINSGENDCYSPSNVTFPGDGAMHLNVTDQSSSCGGATHPYTGAAVTTNPADGRGTGGYQYTYGVLEARVYIPADGTQIADWPAVWADGQSWPTNGEDDVMEGLGGVACFHFHDPLGGPGNCDSKITPGWHTFASDWQPGSVTYYYDGLKVGSITSGITNAPQYIILDNTVRTIDPSSTEASSMRVAYVRVWQD